MIRDWPTLVWLNAHSLSVNWSCSSERKPNFLSVILHNLVLYTGDPKINLLVEASSLIEVDKVKASLNDGSHFSLFKPFVSESFAVLSGAQKSSLYTHEPMDTCLYLSSNVMAKLV